MKESFPRKMNLGESFTLSPGEKQEGHPDGFAEQDRLFDRGARVFVNVISKADGGAIEFPATLVRNIRPGELMSIQANDPSQNRSTKAVSCELSGNILRVETEGSIYEIEPQ